MNMNKCVISLTVPSIAFNFNLRERKRTLIAFEL